MKDFIKFFSIITGLFRSIFSILLLFATGFVVFVDNHLFLASLDLLGINNISPALIKPLALGGLILAFVINTGITRSIFKAGENGKTHLVNVFFGLVFLGLDAFLYFYFREKLLYILLGLNGLIVLNSLIGLIARFKGIYDTGIIEKKAEYIEVKTGLKEKDPTDNPIKLDFVDGDEKEEVKILKKTDTEVDGETVIRSTQLIEKDTDLGNDTEGEIIKAEEVEAILENKGDSQPKLDQDDLSKEESDKNSLSKKDAEEKNPPSDFEGTNKKINKLVEDEGKTDKTYDPDLAEDFKKKEEAKIYNKSNFVKNED
ncbi:hypothetical protein [uncultured Anaerococcus sp.]|uniref:hypothetical protein n=1 Tax=uncultured Anaerococcus sp. TaxID=293428 RepID=UPI00288A31D6|nr:hypothetical protein [uncultured Anaerococcus sp.]